MTAPNGPRITPLPPDQWPDEVVQAIAALRPPDARHSLRRQKGGPKGLNVLGTLARHPSLMHAFHSFNGHILYGTTLSARQRASLSSASVPRGPITRNGVRRVPKCDCSHPVSQTSGIPTV